MERLTERTSDGILVKEDYGEDVLKTLYQCYGAEVIPHYANCDEGYCAMEKLAAYEDAEEQGLLMRLPCKVGDTVYLITSDGKVAPRTADMMFLGVLWDEYGKEWFLTQEEAEEKLKESGGSNGS